MRASAPVITIVGKPGCHLCDDATTIVRSVVAELGADKIVRIDQVWVTPEARELGFGDEMLATTIASASARGAIAVEGQALPGDRHTKNLYERAGIVARLITTFKTL